MDLEVLMTGIGGQGIQLASKVLAQAASREGRSVMHFGVYGGMIRGGPSDCTVVASDGEILAPPIVDEAWGLIAMHPGSLQRVLPKIRPGGFVLLNSTLCLQAPERGDLVVMPVPATRVAEDAGAIVGASMVAVGAFVEATAFVAIDSVHEAMAAAIPSHRKSLVALNRKCLDLGSAHVRKMAPGPAARAWARPGGAPDFTRVS